MELSITDFERFQRLIYDMCGLVVPEGKEYLIKQRLEPLATAMGHTSFDAFYHQVVGDSSSRVRDKIVEALTTNETTFFRDGHPFETFKNNILPQLEDLIRLRKARPHTRRGAKVHIWSAASSTGQEAYSLAMLIHEYTRAKAHTGLSKDDFAILATDISAEVLAQAITAEYTGLDVSRGLPPAYRAKYFRAEGNVWCLTDSVKSMVEFRKLNLMKSFSFLEGFDVIFCRNVLIYFDEEAKRRILEQFHQLLTDEGTLFLGASENVYAVSDRFESLHYGESFVYRKAGWKKRQAGILPGALPKTSASPGMHSTKPDLCIG